MLRNLLYFVCGTIICGGCVSSHVTKHCPKQSVEATKPAQVLRHVVLFKFKEGTTAEQVRAIESAFSSLPSKIEAIYDFEWGTNVSVEDLAQGFTHCFVVTFRSEAGRAEYLPHPAHKEFGSILRPHLEKALVVDYWTSL